jgi:hypothetical protein
MIAKWLMGERFVITTPLAKRATLKMHAPRRNSLALVSFG